MGDLARSKSNGTLRVPDARRARPPRPRLRVEDAVVGDRLQLKGVEHLGHLTNHARICRFNVLQFA